MLSKLISAVNTFLFEAPLSTKRAPHIRDSVDLKRWMMLVVVSLIPCTLMAIWNTGVQKFAYTSGLLPDYVEASKSFSGYFAFCGAHFGSILMMGLGAFLPILLISYAVGGFWEAVFAAIRRHEIAEGFLVTGILYALILPPTIPYWMAAVGISFGVIVGKELFGGTGMNILNPALTARIFLFFSFPAALTGPVWVGTNPTTVANDLVEINQGIPSWDAYTQASPLAKYNVGDQIKRIHVDAIAAYAGKKVGTLSTIDTRLEEWKEGASLDALTPEELQRFLVKGLGLPAESIDEAYQFSREQYSGIGNLFFGNRIGSFGETSILCVILGALFLMWVGIGSWRTMAAVVLGAFVTAAAFEIIARTVGPDHGAWNIARYAFPAYKQFFMGSLAFGLVFMATEPVSSPYMSKAKWVYGFLIGFLVIFIRAVNPAYPEGVMLAILFANVFSPLFDYYAVRKYRRRRV